ncbi:hypothetical protein BCR43DRAFT_483265 [Syncephalastrum racemosum]|uniref:Late embryogenesis abundant protein LEA-2 subgroup domain-containing protein n=1 Tax=Syncephalastrum racemosum TaxID=13706 RepID=A0A1X2HUX5_SYNRA|nr:hypothetical protein BCR43DRAFT_483265 [Syncephalastrum racemosum]
MALPDAIHNDPYRSALKAIRGSSDFDDCSRPGSEWAGLVAHSRSGSDSSTQRLTTTAARYEDDPYARQEYPSSSSGGGAESAERCTSLRANSYLPYSHHARDPYARVEPIYIEDKAPSLLQPALSMQTDVRLEEGLSQSNPPILGDHEKQDHQVRKEPMASEEDWLSLFAAKRASPGHGWRAKTRCCGLTRGTVTALGVIAILAVIVVIWAIVWPRVPRMSFAAANNTSPPQWSKDALSYNATWSVNLTAINDKNIIPTRIDSMALSVVDHDTGVAFGSGSLSNFLLPTGSTILQFPVSISYTTTNASDPTKNDLYDACGPQVASFSPTLASEQQDLTLAIDFYVTIRIAGLVWSNTRVAFAPSFDCPVD